MAGSYANRSGQNVTAWSSSRQFVPGLTTKFQRKFQVNLPLARRLGLEEELEGHTGCVNCLDWNEGGDLLASGSDDFNIILWDIKRKRPHNTLKSGHEGNIFSVKFLPCSTSNLVASAAADATVRVHCTSTSQCTRSFTCHTRRVKRLSVTPQSPYLIWSGSEDGTVRQFDLREPHNCSSVRACANVIINLTENIGPASEVKCIQVHSTYPELLAVGGSDPFVRLYDRRMINNKTRNGASHNETPPPPAGCVSYFTPGHLQMRTGRGKPSKHRNYVTTHVAFSPDGAELLQNLGGEHVYLYNIYQKRKPLVFPLSSSTHECGVPPPMKRNAPSRPLSTQIGSTSNMYHETSTGLNSTYASRKDRCSDGFNSESPSSTNELPESAFQLKKDGNDAFSEQNYFQAVICYSKALHEVPNSSVLYANRAAALLKRCW